VLLLHITQNIILENPNFDGLQTPKIWNSNVQGTTFRGISIAFISEIYLASSSLHYF
jgi:hypothetical protein